ncbi:MAG: SRPBCC family protein [Acidimicrobiia bacterium]|nr:SRPBCC family protein [Acidimicrobiia bacterium]
MSRLIPEPRRVVWSALANLSSHADWMADADSITFAGDQTSGPGTVMRVPTRVGPFRTLDIIEITGWVEGERIDAEHRGIVTGAGSFALTDRPDGTLLTWGEDLRFPWWLGGAIGASIARPILRRIWANNLARFEKTLSSP